MLFHMNNIVTTLYHGKYDVHVNHARVTFLKLFKYQSSTPIVSERLDTFMSFHVTTRLQFQFGHVARQVMSLFHEERHHSDTHVNPNAGMKTSNYFDIFSRLTEDSQILKRHVNTLQTIIYKRPMFE